MHPVTIGSPPKISALRVTYLESVSEDIIQSSIAQYIFQHSRI
ncbi:hypothetical protein CKA32_003459 [Geitlerinema sp. FC II]|nr:hypothetical protein CKA32_003459 [Geitlerinema sp. FC II]